MWCDLWPLWPPCASADDSRTCPFAPGAGTCTCLGREGRRLQTPQLIKTHKRLLTRCSDWFLLICNLQGKISWANVVFWWISSYLMRKDDRKSYNSHAKSISLMSHKSRLIPQEWQSTHVIITLKVNVKFNVYTHMYPSSGRGPQCACDCGTGGDPFCTSSGCWRAGWPQLR